MDNPHRPNSGWIEVITGSMFSGKSEELIRRLRRAQIAKQKVQIFKPKIDNRYGDDHITSHGEMRIASKNSGSSGSTRDSSSTQSCPRFATRWPIRGSA